METEMGMEIELWMRIRLNELKGWKTRETKAVEHHRRGKGRQDGI